MATPYINRIQDALRYLIKKLHFFILYLYFVSPLYVIPVGISVVSDLGKIKR